MAFAVPSLAKRVFQQFTPRVVYRRHVCLRNAQQLTVRSMSAAPRRTDGELINDVLTHWFGSTSVSRYDPLADKRKVWFSSNKEFDDEIREKFGEDVELAIDGKWDHLIGDDRHDMKGELALVIMLDQYTRNLYRRSAKAFAGDQKSLEVVKRVLAPDQWARARETLPLVKQVSFLMPLMHQETLPELDTCVEKLTELISDCEEEGEKAEQCAKFLRVTRDYARTHRDIIAKFQRYPHRNAALGRQSTPEELEYLRDGPSFGQ